MHHAAGCPSARPCADPAQHSQFKCHGMRVPNRLCACCCPCAPFGWTFACPEPMHCVMTHGQYWPPFNSAKAMAMQRMTTMGVLLSCWAPSNHIMLTAHLRLASAVSMLSIDCCRAACCWCDFRSERATSSCVTSSWRSERSRFRAC